MTVDRQPDAPKPKGSRVEVYWTTVTYKTVAMYLIAIFALIMGVLYVIFPEHFANVGRKFQDAMGGKGDSSASPMSTQARFVNLDGKVEVKKVNSVQWVTANSGTMLSKGDLIQTGSDSLARIVFPDGTQYTVKPDTLITVEENMVSQDRSTLVGVHITSGVVDLATPTFEVPNSRAEVSFENARASVRENSRVAVRSDPQSNRHEITVTQGKANLDRGGQSIEIAKFERVSFPTGGDIQRSRVLAPPELLRPSHLHLEVASDPKRTPILFEWKPVQGAVSYELQISNSSMFVNLVAERRTNSTNTVVTGLDAGDYYWAVKALDAQKHVSEPSETLKFTLAAQGKSQEMFLEVGEAQLHGNVVEITGRTEPGAVILIDGQPVANIQADGTFRHFTPALSRGSHTIVITGQNRRGNVAIRKVNIVVP